MVYGLNMRFLLYSIISISILFLSYRIRLSRVFIISILASVFILVNRSRAFPYETVIYLLFINTVPIVAEGFRRDFNRHKEAMRTKFEAIKKSYEELMRRDRRQIESNLEREKNLQQVLSLYEISKEMTSCLMFEDIFNILSTTLKRSFRFRRSRIVLLKGARGIEAVYQIASGHRPNRLAPDDFDREIVRIVLETGQMISISPQAHPPDFSRSLSIIKDFETLIAMPFFVEEKIAGVLYVENIPGVHFENFIILARQFAIQFQKVMLYKRVQEMAITDSLTQLATRRYFLERFKEEIRRSMRRKSSLSLLMVDLDHFKEKNDRFGHLVGDVVLKEVASLLKSNLREIDVIGRYGGEEFSIVLAGIGREGAFQVAGRIRESVAGAVFKAYDETVSTTLSIGVGVFPDDGVDIESLVEAADKALYKAKELGRNRVALS